VNYGDNMFIMVRQQPDPVISYVKFPLRRDGAGGRAEMQLYLRRLELSSAGSIECRAYASTEDWQEHAMTWSQRAPVGAPLGGPVPVGSTDRWYAFDVTAAVQAGLAAGRASVTIALQCLAPSALVKFESRDYEGGIRHAWFSPRVRRRRLRWNIRPRCSCGRGAVTALA